MVIRVFSHSAVSDDLFHRHITQAERSPVVSPTNLITQSSHEADSHLPPFAISISQKGHSAICAEMCYSSWQLRKHTCWNFSCIQCVRACERVCYQTKTSNQMPSQCPTSNTSSSSSLVPNTVTPSVLTTALSPRSRSRVSTLWQSR